MKNTDRHCDPRSGEAISKPDHGGTESQTERNKRLCVFASSWCEINHLSSWFANGWKRLILILSVAAFVFGNTNPVSAQAGIDMDASATYVFGQQITFSAQIKSAVQIQGAKIIIFDERQGVAQVQPVEFMEGRSEYRLDVRQARLVPFSFIRWHYELTLADGSLLQSDSFSIRYEDNRHAWQSLEAGSIHVMWAQGDAFFGQHALNAALSGLQSINDILPTDLNQPVNLYIYPSQNDISFLSGESWEAGRAYPDPGLALVAIEPDSNQSIRMEQRIPHELMHVMLYRQVGAGYENLPAWLNEGIATLAEINPTSDYDLVLQDASDSNELIPLSDLCASFPADSAAAFLAYSEARSFTSYLRDAYGAPALLNLAKTYAGGTDCENGFKNVFNLSLSQMEATWREKSLGQNVLGAAFRNMLPYLALLCLLILVPWIVGLNSSRQKAGQNGSGNSSNR